MSALIGLNRDAVTFEESTSSKMEGYIHIFETKELRFISVTETRIQAACLTRASYSDGTPQKIMSSGGINA